jgi:chorismate mutase/prephenate dehydratase
VCGEIYLDIAQQLLSRAADLGEIKRVLSHPQGLAQCRNWLAEHLPGVPTEETTSTSAAAEQAAADPSLAAIASALAGLLYNVPVLRPGIEDLPDNSTRFLLIGRRPTGPTGHDKTSIVFAMKDEPGVLYRILEPCARLGINLSKIESRPAKRRPWRHVSFVDLDGHRESEAVSGVLREIAERTVFLKVLGSYPAA